MKIGELLHTTIITHEGSLYEQFGKSCMQRHTHHTLWESKDFVEQYCENLDRLIYTEGMGMKMT